MLQTSQPTVFVHVYAWHEQPRRPPGVARCLFGRPNPAETKKQLDEELAKNCKRFSSRYEVCKPDILHRSPSHGLTSPLVSKDDSRRKRMDSASNTPKRQKLLTGKLF